MNPTLESPADLAAAHPLFPPDQAFLWLPGLPGRELPWCSYNVRRTRARRRAALPLPGDAKTPLAAPHPVSPVTFISWDCGVEPPFPYHPVPVVRPLSPEELRSLALRVIQMTGDAASLYPDPLQVLKNARKSQVIAALAEAGLLTRGIARGQQAG